jgi:hypothetical protein
MDQNIQWDVRGMVRAVGGVHGFRDALFMCGLKDISHSAVRAWLTRDNAPASGIAALVHVLKKAGRDPYQFIQIGGSDHGEADTEAA